MKKIFNFISLLLILFFVFACDWQVPSNIQIKGSPGLKFAADMDFSEEFRDILHDALYDSDREQDNVVIQDCINAPDWMTFLIRVGLVDFAQEIEESINDAVVVGGNFTLPQDVHLIQTDTTLLFSEFVSFLKDFKFKTDKIESGLFIKSSDNDFDIIKINLDFYNIDETTGEKGILNKPGFSGNISNKPSGIDLNSNEYGGIGVPPGGINVGVTEYLNEKDDIIINLDVFLEAGKPYPVALLNKLKAKNKLEIDVELVIWLPLVFEVGAGSEFILPGFEDLGDFLYSLTTDSGDMIKSLILEIGLAHNPFTGGTFICRNVQDDKKSIFKIDMEANLISFNVSPEDVAYINRIKESETDFETEFVIEFKKTAELGIPKTLKIMSIAVEAVIDHIIEI
jgi:hypothetical protein